MKNWAQNKSEKPSLDPWSDSYGLFDSHGLPAALRENIALAVTFSRGRISTAMSAAVTRLGALFDVALQAPEPHPSEIAHQDPLSTAEIRKSNWPPEE